MPTALVVDDSRTMRDILTRQLRGLGWSVLAVADGPGCLRLLTAGLRPDVLVVDCVLPRMSGTELVRVVRQDPGLGAVPVLVVTADSGADGVREALEAGADEYLMKPFTADALESKLALLERAGV